MDNKVVQKLSYFVRDGQTYPLLDNQRGQKQSFIVSEGRGTVRRVRNREGKCKRVKKLMKLEAKIQFS